MQNAALNAICPYFTMFPLKFPLRVLRGRAHSGDWVLDPFAGRGTTNVASRLMGLPSVGVDSSPVAFALTQAKLANTCADDITAAVDEILATDVEPQALPSGEFWSLAYDADVLYLLCKLREALLRDCRSDARRALRGILLGALHGPKTKRVPSHLSNQCMRTYAPKPGYAIRFWKSRALSPPKVDIREIVRIRATRYYAGQEGALGTAVMGDSRDAATFASLEHPIRWIVTSPPFYGMRTYLPDQWLRNWFVGGPAQVDYSNANQLSHRSPSSFADQLRLVWQNVGDVSAEGARLVVRFGGISDRDADPLDILKLSFQDSPWRIQTIINAGSAEQGKRQAAHFAGKRPLAGDEHDAWLCLR